MKNRFLLILKIVVSVISLSLVMRMVDISSLSEVARGGINLVFAFMALAIFWAAQIVSSLRYAYIANQLGGSLSHLNSIRVHFIGLWFNQVLPTGLGGDVLKVAILKQAIGLGVALRSAILDRLSGLLVLMLIITITLPFYFDVIPFQQHNLVFGLGVLSIGFIVTIIIFAWVSTKIRNRLISTSWISKLIEPVSDVWHFRKGRQLWEQLWTSTIVHLNGIATYCLLGKAIGVDVNILIFALLVPLIFLIALLPISFAGWGVREIGAIWLFGMVGVPKENALVLSVAYGLLLIFAGFPGLIMFARNRLN